MLCIFLHLDPPLFINSKYSCLCLALQYLLHLITDFLMMMPVDIATYYFHRIPHSLLNSNLLLIHPIRIHCLGITQC